MYVAMQVDIKRYYLAACFPPYFRDYQLTGGQLNLRKDG